MTGLDAAGARPHPSGVAIQKRVVFAPEDVAVVRLVCGECGNDYGWHNGCKSIQVPTECPFCKVSWKGSNYESWMWVVQFLERTKEVSNPQSEPQFSIRLEVDIEGLRSPE